MMQCHPRPRRNLLREEWTVKHCLRIRAQVGTTSKHHCLRKIRVIVQAGFQIGSVAMAETFITMIMGIHHPYLPQTNQTHRLITQAVKLANHSKYRRRTISGGRMVRLRPAYPAEAMCNKDDHSTNRIIRLHHRHHQKQPGHSIPTPIDIRSKQQVPMTSRSPTECRVIWINNNNDHLLPRGYPKLHSKPPIRMILNDRAIRHLG